MHENSHHETHGLIYFQEIPDMSGLAALHIKYPTGYLMMSSKEDTDADGGILEFWAPHGLVLPLLDFTDKERKLMLRRTADLSLKLARHKILFEEYSKSMRQFRSKLYKFYTDNCRK